MSPFHAPNSSTNTKKARLSAASSQLQEQEPFQTSRSSPLNRLPQSLTLHHPYSTSAENVVFPMSIWFSNSLDLEIVMVYCLANSGVNALLTLACQLTC